MTEIKINDRAQNPQDEDADVGTVLAINDDGTVVIAWDGAACKTTESTDGLVVVA